MTALWKRMTAEFVGTFWLVFGGCGSAVLAAWVIKTEGSTPINLGIGLVGVSLAFGLTVLTMAYAIGHISGCHLNPAVTVGLATANRFSWADVPTYIGAQLGGAISAAGLLMFIALNHVGTTTLGDFAANGYGAKAEGGHSPADFTVAAAFAIEAVLTAVFLLVILGSTDRKAPAGFAPLPIGLCLTLIHLISIPVTNTSVNPARSTSQAIFCNNAESGNWALGQLWLFWLAPIVGAIVAGLIHRFVFSSDAEGEKKVA